MSIQKVNRVDVRREKNREVVVVRRVYCYTPDIRIPALNLSVVVFRPQSLDELRRVRAAGRVYPLRAQPLRLSVVPHRPG